MLDVSDEFRVGGFEDLRKPLDNIEEEHEAGGQRPTQDSFIDLIPQPEEQPPTPRSADRFKSLFSSKWNK